MHPKDLKFWTRRHKALMISMDFLIYEDLFQEANDDRRSKTSNVYRVHIKYMVWRRVLPGSRRLSALLFLLYFLYPLVFGPSQGFGPNPGLWSISRVHGLDERLCLGVLQLRCVGTSRSKERGESRPHGRENWRCKSPNPNCPNQNPKTTKTQRLTSDPLQNPMPARC